MRYMGAYPGVGACPGYYGMIFSWLPFVIGLTLRSLIFLYSVNSFWSIADNYLPVKCSAIKYYYEHSLTLACIHTSLPPQSQYCLRALVHPSADVWRYHPRGPHGLAEWEWDSSQLHGRLSRYAHNITVCWCQIVSGPSCYYVCFKLFLSTLLWLI